MYIFLDHDASLDNAKLIDLINFMCLLYWNESRQQKKKKKKKKKETSLMIVAKKKKFATAGVFLVT